MSTEAPNDFVIREGFPALLRADGKGPLIEGEEPLPARKFASYKNALRVSPESVHSLLEDCNTVFSARTKNDGAAYSVGCTYFVPCQMRPRCALEGLALRIFETHAAALTKEDGKGLIYDPERSGAEWWTLVMDAAPPKLEQAEKGDNKGSDEEDDDDEVGMHFDADYGLESNVRHMLLHPRVATVTYLSDVGAPTLVLDRKSPLFSDVEKKSLSGSVKSAWLSSPYFGKHMCFDGRLFHGAPAAFFPGVAGGEDEGGEPRGEPPAKRPKLGDDSTTLEKQRVTFLVNVWINHCPVDAEILDEDVCHQLRTPWEPPTSPTESNNLKSDEAYKPPFEWKLKNANDSDTFKYAKLAPSESDPAGSEETVACHREVTINFGASMEDMLKCCQEAVGGESMELELQDGAINISVGHEVESSDDEGEEAA